MTQSMLGRQLKAGLDAVREEIAQIVGEIVSRAGNRVIAPRRERFLTPLSRIGATVDGLGHNYSEQPLTFKLAVIGRFSTGKSTLLSGVAGAALTVQRPDGGTSDGLLPEGDSPCTAIPTFLHGGEEGLQIFLVEQRETEGGKVELRQPISFEELKAMHFHPAGDSKDPFPDVDHIDIEGVLPSALDNVVLIDTLGADDRPASTARTLGVAAAADAIIALFRLDMGSIATPDELAFLERAAPAREKGGKKIFFVINEFKRRDFDSDEVAYLWDLILGETGRAPTHSGQSLAEGDIFVVNANAAKRGRLDGDEALLERSGLLKFEARLADFLAKEALRAKLQPVVGDLVVVSQEALKAVEAEIRRMKNRRVDAEVVRDTTLEPLRKLIAALEDLSFKTERTAESIREQIKRSFEAAMMSSANDVRAALDNHEMQSLSNVGQKLRHLVWKKPALSEIQDVLRDAIQSRMSAWASDTSNVTSAVRIFESEQQALIEIIARRFAEVEISLDQAREQLLGEDVAASVESLRARISSWRVKLEAALAETVRAQTNAVSLVGEYFAAAFGAIVMGGLAKIGLVPAAKLTLLKIGSAMGLKAAFVGAAGVVALPITVAAGAIGALFATQNAADKLKKKILTDFMTKMEATSERAWGPFAETLSETIDGAKERFDRQISDVSQGARLELDALIAEASANLTTLQDMTRSREQDAATISTLLARLGHFLIEQDHSDALA